MEIGRKSVSQRKSGESRCQIIFSRMSVSRGPGKGVRNRFRFSVPDPFSSYRNLTVQEHITKYRKGGVKEVLPSEALNMTVEEALRRNVVGGVKVRKLLTDLRDKFVK
jgi:hypothetical protein